jgi:perosamine synthetase
MEEEDLEGVRRVLSSGRLVQGIEVRLFEENMAKYVGTTHAVAVSSGTAALHLALLTAGVTPGDVVLVPAYSFVASANVVELCGARPVFVDVERTTFNMDPHHLTETVRRLTGESATSSRVKAILPVHCFGQPADMPEILKIGRDYGIAVVEDAACALGSSLAGKRAGAWGAMGCFSFHPRKAITTGEGGMVTTSDPGLARQLRVLRNHGQDPEKEEPDFVAPGFNYRMTEFQAVLGSTQLAKLDRIIEARQQLAARYDDLFVGKDVRAPVVLRGSEPNYQSYVVLLPEEKSRHRKAMIEYLKIHGIETTIGTYHIPLTAYYRSRYGYREGEFPVSESVFLRALTLPLFEHLRHDEQEEIVQRLQNALDGCGR